MFESKFFTIFYAMALLACMGLSICHTFAASDSELDSANSSHVASTL